jgi:hypothetical protein
LLVKLFDIVLCPVVASDNLNGNILGWLSLEVLLTLAIGVWVVLNGKGRRKIFEQPRKAT